ncbi:hypothetical protein LIER_16884 [Lithospermum erythrorhizon]|uniref:Uncharacterized protein n=1 Tax=Lithospermum erythrorhizon TaxID=34254 RepID=A0AAV3QA91_LITER
MVTKTLKVSRILKIIKAPMKTLSKVRDFYVRSMIKCGGNTGEVAGGMPQMAHYFPRSFNKDEDLRELIRAASIRSTSNNMIGESEMRAICTTVIIRRIDEDKPSEFGDNEVNMDMIMLRSRSSAVSTRYRRM